MTYPVYPVKMGLIDRLRNFNSHILYSFWSFRWFFPFNKLNCFRGISCYTQTATDTIIGFYKSRFFNIYRINRASFVGAYSTRVAIIMIYHRFIRTGCYGIRIM